MVTVPDESAFTGVTGVVVSNDGRDVWVRFGTIAWKVEAWRLSPFDVDDMEAQTRTAA